MAISTSLVTISRLRRLGSLGAVGEHGQAMLDISAEIQSLSYPDTPKIRGKNILQLSHLFTVNHSWLQFHCALLLNHY